MTTAAGGNTDLMARMAAEHLTAKFGKTFVVENRPSAGGAQATGQVVSAAPDGYSLLFSHSAAVLLAPLVQKMSFDPDKSLTPVTNVGTGSQVVAIKRSLPVNNLAEFLAYAKANPKKLNFAAAGTNNISHLAPLLLFARAGVDVVMVPSRGEPQAISDLIGRQCRFLFRQYVGASGAKRPSGDQAAGGRHCSASGERAGHPDRFGDRSGICLRIMERLLRAQRNA